MKLDDLITEAPMGLVSRIANKIKSFVPGDIGSTSQGKLMVGRVANHYKKEFMTWLGQTGQQATAKNIMTFFSREKSNRISPQLVGRALGTLKEAQKTERVYTSKELDQLMLKIAQGAAAGDGGKGLTKTLPSPSISQQIKTGISKMIPSKGSSTPTQPSQRITPTLPMPTPTSTPPQTTNPAKPAPQASVPQPTPNRKSKKRKVKPVRKFSESVYIPRDEFEKIQLEIIKEGLSLEDLGFRIDLIESTIVVLKKTANHSF